jgi:hypothetical protein
LRLAGFIHHVAQVKRRCPTQLRHDPRARRKALRIKGFSITAGH